MQSFILNCILSFQLRLAIIICSVLINVMILTASVKWNQSSRFLFLYTVFLRLSVAIKSALVLSFTFLQTLLVACSDLYGHLDPSSLDSLRYFDFRFLWYPSTNTSARNLLRFSCRKPLIIRLLTSLGNFFHFVLSR